MGTCSCDEHDVEADALAADLERAAVARLHDPGAAAGDDVDRLVERRRAARDDGGEAARLLVVARHRERASAAAFRRRGVAAVARRRELALGDVGGDDAGAAEEDDRRLDALLVLDQLGLEQLELQADRPQLLAQQEVDVGEGEPVRAFGPFVARARG